MTTRLILRLAVIGLMSVVFFFGGYRPSSHVYFATLDKGEVEIMAHGAGQGVAPTNTLLALERAHAAGADVLEVDVQLTRDDVLILHHDDTLDRTTDLSGPVANKTWEEIIGQDKGASTTIEGVSFSGDDTKVARLDEALGLYPDARWNIEIKNNSAHAGELLCIEVTKAGLTAQTLVASFHGAAMAGFRGLCPEVATSMTPGEIRSFVLAAQLGVSRFVRTAAVAVQVPISAGGFDLTDKRFIAALKARDIKLHYWTINDPVQMDTLIKAGADGILTDYVARGQAASARALNSKNQR
jgi:glycerophosphoryl diester phosphodiesterase